MNDKIKISKAEYERLLQKESLYHKQRFTIARLEKDIEKQKVRSSLFAKKTLELLLDSGYSMEVLMAYYKGVNYDTK